MKKIITVLFTLLVIVFCYFVFFHETPVKPSGENVSGNEPINPCDLHDCSIGK